MAGGMVPIVAERGAMLPGCFGSMPLHPAGESLHLAKSVGSPLSRHSGPAKRCRGGRSMAGRVVCQPMGVGDDNWRFRSGCGIVIRRATRWPQDEDYAVYAAVED
jgi:hypothetical protein